MAVNITRFLPKSCLLVINDIEITCGGPQLRETVSGLRDGCHERLRAAMGDTRTGAELLADYYADRRP